MFFYPDAHPGLVTVKDGAQHFAVGFSASPHRGGFPEQPAMLAVEKPRQLPRKRPKKTAEKPPKSDKPILSFQPKRV